MSISLKLFNSAGAGGDAGGDAAPAAEDAGGDAGQEIYTLNISEARNIFFTLSTYFIKNKESEIIKLSL